jgi:hypothetical protein
MASWCVVGERWEWDAARSVLKVYVKASDIKNAVNVVVK